jgi:hypothetical protein
LVKKSWIEKIFKIFLEHFGHKPVEHMDYWVKSLDESDKSFFKEAIDACLHYLDEVPDFDTFRGVLASVKRRLSLEGVPAHMIKAMAWNKTKCCRHSRFFDINEYEKRRSHLMSLDDNEIMLLFSKRMVTEEDMYDRARFLLQDDLHTALIAQKSRPFKAKYSGGLTMETPQKKPEIGRALNNPW